MEKLPMTDADMVRFTKAVKGIKFFAAMNMGLLEKILNRIGYYRYGKGEKVCRQGEIGDAFYVVSEGRLSVKVSSALIFSKKLAELGPGGCFGEMSLLERKPRNATVVCEETSKLFALTFEHFDRVLNENPAFREEIKKLAAERKFERERG
ncbi:MAG: hypothetical protein COT17_00975 [Elusimicrobia bacterium CG08_land_8_20_14_0_20_51_18]|nr:MAG: hypothetical protein COT17_00975 [Elusimicrobia bacterium CG08_land_8_20_14_0_20_51_18]